MAGSVVAVIKKRREYIGEKKAEVSVSSFGGLSVHMCMGG